MDRTATKRELTLLETEEAIFCVKQEFQRRLAESLGLFRVSAPLFVDRDSVHPHPSDGNGADLIWVIKLCDGIADGRRRPSPNLFGLPNRPLGMLITWVEFLGRAAASCDLVSVRVVNHSF